MRIRCPCCGNIAYNRKCNNDGVIIVSTLILYNKYQLNDNLCCYLCDPCTATCIYRSLAQLSEGSHEAVVVRHHAGNFDIVRCNQPSKRNLTS